MTDNDAHDTAVPETTQLEAPVSAEPEPDVLSFADHMERADGFIADCQQELRRRGIHACEAIVFVDWQGQIVLQRNDMTAANGVLQVNCRIPPPWNTLEPDDVKTLLTKAFQACENGMVELCSRAKALRISFAAHGRRVSQRVVTVSGNGNGHPRLVMP